ncbi:MAG: SDR family oxidoreductase [Pseudomonadota bacterium]
MARHLLSFGHGYTARVLSERLMAEGWTVTGTTRSDVKARTLAQSGTHVLRWPEDDLEPAIGAASHILTSVSPDEDKDPVLDAAADLIRQAAGGISWIGYLSTTGVYGDHSGGWVDETTPLNPKSARALRRVAAEKAWLDLGEKTGIPVQIFRLAGIYGPQRGPFQKVRAGTAQRVIKENQFFSRIHVDDIAQVLEASMARPNAGAVYNVCDDEPAPPEDVIAYAAELMGLPLPPEIPFEEAEMSPMAREFYMDSRRVRNDRIKDELGVELLYPDYRAGLNALAEGL